MTSNTPQANRFRFRAWQDLLKEMRYFDLFELQAIDSLLDYKAINNGTLRIMQSTGLLDRNGKEIFEGDILQFKDGDVNVGGYKEIAGGNYLVVWESSIAKYMLKRTDQARWLRSTGIGSVANRRKEWSLIGNLYETPHLLPNHI